MKNTRLKIVFLGTPEFATPFLQALINSDYEPVLVITQPDERIGRKQEWQSPPVKVLALANQLKVLQPKTKKELCEILTTQRLDLAVLVAYGMIIDDKTIELPRLGFINVHPSLLPKYRGPSPVQTAILSGEQKTGVSIMLLDSQVDHGPVLTQEVLTIKKDDTNQSLHRRLAQVGSDLLIKTLPQYISGQLQAQIQNNALASQTHIISRQDGLINWQKSAIEIDRQFRAFYPWPGVFSHWSTKRLKIVNLSVLEGDFDHHKVPGTVFLGPNKTPAVICGQGAVELKMVQLEGKKEMSGEDFWRGYSSLAGQVLT